MRLRAEGYNARISEALRDASGGLASGNYEYLDVVEAAEDPAEEAKGRKYIVDVDFAAEFQGARATEGNKAVAVAREEAARRAGWK